MKTMMFTYEDLQLEQEGLKQSLLEDSSHRVQDGRPFVPWNV
jgi:hypothetical protein